MKLVIQIPCLNEEKTLPETIRDLPGQMKGIDEIEIVVIDDGSTDRTGEVARELGVTRIVKFPNRKGLAKAFLAGLDASLKLGADIIVNTDADNQYRGEDIPRLIAPILGGRADIVVGDRRVDTIRHFSFLKRRLQKIGSWVVRQVSNTTIPDATSGFRAYSKEAALRLYVFSEFTYTLETIIQAGHNKFAIGHVRVGVNEKLRDSRLFSNMWGYVRNSISTIFRIFTLYKPLKVFSIIGGTTLGFGILVGLRFLYYLAVGDGQGHIQSLILASMLIIVGFQIMVIGLLADLIAANRELIGDVLFRVKKLELGNNDNDKKSEQS